MLDNIKELCKIMKAIVCTKSGSPEVLQFKEIEKPIPKDNEVLIRIYATTVTSGDVILRKLHPLFFLLLRWFGLKRKKIPGHELAGEIETAPSTSPSRAHAFAVRDIVPCVR